MEEEPKYDLVAIELALVAEREVLVAKVAELSKNATTNGGYDSNFADSSAVIAERGEAEAQSANLAHLLEDVERALARISNGTYGSCESCHLPIDPARLDAIPTARFCRECAMAGKR